MSQETVQPNPVENGGMTPDQQQTAIELRQQIDERAADVADFDRQSDEYTRGWRRLDGTYRGPTATGEWINTVGHAVVQHGLNKAQRAAKSHYRKNEGDYQEQALKEATEADKDVQGWPQE